MIHRDNPAGRLYVLLDALRSNQQLYQQPLLRALSLTLGTPTLPGLMRRLSYVLAMPGQIEVAIGAIDPDLVDHEFSMRWKPRVEQALTLVGNLDGNITKLAVELLDDGTMMSLEACNMELHRHRKEKTASQGDIDVIQGLLKDFRKTIHDAELDADLFELLMSYNSAMQKAVSDYPIRGIGALEEGFDQSNGSLARNPQLVEKVIEQHPNIRERVWAITSRVALLLAIPASAVQIATGIQGELEASPKPAPVSTVVNQTVSTGVVIIEDGAQGGDLPKVDGTGKAIH